MLSDNKRNFIKLMILFIVNTVILCIFFFKVSSEKETQCVYTQLHAMTAYRKMFFTHSLEIASTQFITTQMYTQFHATLKFRATDI